MENLFRPPEPLVVDGNVANNWKRFNQKFDVFMTASGLEKKSEETKVAVFLNLLGDDGLELYNSFTFTEEELKSLDSIKARFKEYCSPQENVIFERCKFNSICQNEGQTFDSFLTELRKAVKTTGYTEPDDMIRDRVVMGIYDKNTQERLLREPKLTLTKTIDLCRATEASKTQSKILQSELQVSAIHSQGKKYSFQKGYKNAASNASANSSQGQTLCKYCGYKHIPNGKCPAYGKTCAACQGKNHFAAMCPVRGSSKPQSKSSERSSWKKSVHEVEEEQATGGQESDSASDSESFYVNSLCRVSSVESSMETPMERDWRQVVQIESNNQVEFKLDTGAEDDRIFAPAPDVTRRLGSTTTLSKPEPPGSPPYYRSTSASSSNSASSRGGLELNPKHWWIIATVILLAAAVGVGVPIALKISSGASFEERLEVAARLLEETPLVDGHNDLPWNIRKFMHNKLKSFKFDHDLREVAPWSTSAWSHTDLVRLERGHVTAQFWAAYVPCDSQHKDAVQLTLEQIDVIRRFTEWYNPRLVLCTSSQDIKTAHKDRHMCSLIGVEGGHSLAGSLAVLRTLYHVGVRYLTLTSTCNTPWADCSHVDMPGKKPEHGGLTNFGKAVIKEMNRLGMIVDLSHVSVGTMRDALEVSKAPVIFSHSSAHALCNSTRNVPDETLKKLALNGGIVMVNFYSLFLTCRETATVADAVAHINHIREVAGVENVGIGAGYDGINYVPQGLEDVSAYPTLFAELMGTGKWTVEDLKKLAGLNFIRVMQNVEKIRDEFKRANVPPYEDVMPRQKGTNNCTSQANY